MLHHHLCEYVQVTFEEVRTGFFCTSAQLTDVLQEVREEVQRDHERKLEQLRDDHRREINSIREKYLDEVRGCFRLSW